MKLVKQIHKRNAEWASFESGGIVLHNLTGPHIDKLREELTFPNPQYAAVKKYSKWGTTRVPPFLFYFEDRKDGSFFVPVGTDTSFIDAPMVDYRVEREVKYPKFTLTLRDDQASAAEKYLAQNIPGSKPHASIQMPTGKGKTILALYLASRLKQKTLVVVHKDDLVTGWMKDIQFAFKGIVKPGLIKAGKRIIGEQITVATVQTLNRLPEETLQRLYKEFGFVVQDEMHHCPASSFEIVNKFEAMFRLGLTATPERSDGLTHVMKLFFGDFCSRYEYVESDTDILPVTVIVKSLPDVIVEPILERKHNEYVLCGFNERPLKPNHYLARNVAYDQRPRIPFASVDNEASIRLTSYVFEDVLNEYECGHSCVVFYTQKEHCRIMRDFLIRSGVPEDDIGIYYGDNADNESVLKKAENQRKYITITTYAKSTEGTNVQQWEVAFFVSSVSNGKNVEQAAGRIRRVKKSGYKLKVARIYDYRLPNAYSINRHGAMRDERYRALKFKIESPDRPAFQRGYLK